MSHFAHPELGYSHHVPLFVIIVLGVVFGVSSSTLSRGDDAVDLIIVRGRLQGCGPLPLLSLPRVVVAATVSLLPLLLCLAPSLHMNPLNLIIQTSGDDVPSLLV